MGGRVPRVPGDTLAEVHPWVGRAKQAVLGVPGVLGGPALERWEME